jgi:ArsR family transcriptional regulator
VAADSRTGGIDDRRAHDDRRLRGVLDRRRVKSQEFFATAAGKWDRLREDLFGDSFYLWAVLGLIDPTLTVGDLGCGTGQLAATVAPYVRRVNRRRRLD